MPVLACPNGKWRIGSGPCVYKSKEKADRAYKGYLYAKSRLESLETMPEYLKKLFQYRLDLAERWLQFYEEGLEEGTPLPQTYAWIRFRQSFKKGAQTNRWVMEMGTEKSGFHGHAGIPGHQGGSSSGYPDIGVVGKLELKKTQPRLERELRSLPEEDLTAPTGQLALRVYSSKEWVTFLAEHHLSDNTEGAYDKKSRTAVVCERETDKGTLSHEVGHFVWHEKLDLKARTWWTMSHIEIRMKERTPVSIRGKKDAHELFSEAYKTYHLAKSEGLFRTDIEQTKKGQKFVESFKWAQDWFDKFYTEAKI